MRLSELNTNQSGRIVKISAPQVIKSRLEALGLVKGTRVTMIKYTLARNTYEILADNTRIALRKEEAESVEVAHEND